MDNNLKREIILDNYQDPMNRGLVDDDSYIKVNTNSESCIDDLDVMMKIVDGKIEDIRFDGEACAISTSATSIMIRSLIGKSVGEAEKILSNYRNMINEKGNNVSPLFFEYASILLNKDNDDKYENGILKFSKKNYF